MRKMLLLAMGMLFLCGQLLAQNRSITGKVTDDKGNPVAGANITVKGSKVGASTAPDGTFSLKIPTAAKTITVSSVGFATQDVALGAGNSVAVSLSTEGKGLQEVVVVAYGTQKKADLTGSITTVKAADLENKPFPSVDKGLQGMVAGLQSVATSGAPGSNQAIRIRGISSITASSAPLWVIDGVPVNAGDASRLTTSANLLTTLNPNDIESITVLKDAASTSIYGSRAANGVILVTTKKGKAGKTRFRADGEVGNSDIAYHNTQYNPLSASQYFAVTREGYINAGQTPAQADATIAGLGSGNGNDFNWYKAVVQKGTQQQYNLSASGGNEKTTYYLSGGFFKQGGDIINSDLKRYNAAVRVNTKATDRLTLNLTADGGFTNQHTPLNGGAFGNPVLSSYFILPSKVPYKPDGTYNILTNDFPNGSLFNTVAVSNMDNRFLRELSMRGSASAEYRILNNLKVRSTFGMDWDDLEEDQYNNPLYGDGYAADATDPTPAPFKRPDPSQSGRSLSDYTRYSNWVWTNTVDYHYDISRSGDIYFNVQAGYEAQSSNTYLISVQSKGFPLNPLLTVPAVGATPITSSATISQYTFASLFSSANINYKDRYVISGSYRRDGSSRFSANNLYGNFWSVGGSWNVDKEAFMERIPVITQLKVRGSYGVNGNAGIGNYDWLPLYGYGNNYNSAIGSAPSNVGDLDLTWELNKPLDLGLDISVLKSRINLSVDYYNRKSSDLLLGVTLSRTSGFTTATRNIGEMENKGIELTLNVVPVRTKNFSWTVDANYARNKNRVTSLPFGKDIANGAFLIRQGYDVQTYYARVYKGADPANGDPLWFADSTKNTTTNNYSAAQRIMYASASPKFFGSVTNTINFKGFTVQAQFYYNFGNYNYDQWGAYYEAAGFGATFNKVQRVLARWQKPGDVTYMPKYIANGNKSFQSFSTYYLRQGDFIRLRNLQVGYDVPKNLLSKLKLGSLFFYVRGTNLWTWVKDKSLPWDPEEGVASTSNLDVYIPKTMTVGLNLGF